ncbi:Memo-like protein [Planctomycetes bacterium Pla163]|uniref:Memo-like protein n=1 Tax=Rohdeia mirabilis TaxID=2528008 RepID=A0A518D313_9BACT|nr:Memo-like protein [Planctomycetes bacterium Pla163]
MSAPPPLRRLGVSAPLPGDQVALYDPLGVSASAAGGLLIGLEEWTWAQGFDGETGVVELAQRIGLGARGPVQPEAIAALAEHLSREHLLEDARFRSAQERAFEEFRRCERRVALGAGTEYPSDPFDLRVRLGGVVADDWYMPRLAGALAIWAPGGPLPNASGLYGRAWASVRHARDEIDRIVVLGSVGAPLSQLLVPLAKDFETPLGPVAVDRAALAELGVLPGRDQLAHARASVIERQVLLARLLFPTTPVVPLLVGALETDGDPRSDERVEAALAGLDRIVAMEGRTLIVAAADLYHLRAPHAGTEGGPRGTLMAGARGADISGCDRRALDAVDELDAEAFADIALGDGDPGRASQAAATYLLLRHLEGRPEFEAGELRSSILGYLQCPAPQVLFSAGAAVFYREVAW